MIITCDSLCYDLKPSIAALPPEAIVRYVAKRHSRAQFFSVHKNIVFCFHSLPAERNSHHNKPERQLYNQKGEPVNV